MKKKIMAALLTVAMCVVMVGCGSSVDPNASALETAPPAPESNEPSVVVDPPSEETELTEENWTETEEAKEVEGETLTGNTDLVSDLEGIVIVQADWSNGKVVKYTVYTVDPETAISQEISQFAFTHLYKESEPEYTIVPAWRFSVYGNLYDHFSEDYTKIAATKTILSSGEVHAGWVDTAGNFFDVTEALGEQAQTDFDEPASYYAVGFQDNIFIYVSSKDRQKDQYRGVAIEDLTLGSWEIDTSDKLVLGKSYETWGWLSGYKVTDWLNDDQALIGINQTKCRIATLSTQSLEEYLPGEETHLNWSAVASPDGSRVAFISRPEAGEEINMYIASISGENPTRFEPDFGPLFYPTAANQVSAGMACCYILEWR